MGTQPHLPCEAVPIRKNVVIEHESRQIRQDTYQVTVMAHLGKHMTDPCISEPRSDC